MIYIEIYFFKRDNYSLPPTFKQGMGKLVPYQHHFMDFPLLQPCTNGSRNHHVHYVLAERVEPIVLYPLVHVCVSKGKHYNIPHIPLNIHMRYNVNH